MWVEGGGGAHSSGTLPAPLLPWGGHLPPPRLPVRGSSVCLVLAPPGPCLSKGPSRGIWVPLVSRGLCRGSGMGEG